MTTRLPLPTFLVLALTAPVSASDLDLTRAVVVSPESLSGPVSKATRMLVEEVEARSMARWGQTEKWPAAGIPVIVVGPADEVGKRLDQLGIRLQTQTRSKPEGYQIGVATGGANPVVWV